MNTETTSRTGSEFGPDDIELLKRQLAERGFYVIGRLPPASGKPTRARTPDSRSNAKP